VRTIGQARATTKFGLANLIHNVRRLLWLDRQPELTPPPGDARNLFNTAGRPSSRPPAHPRRRRSPQIR
jgi:hypothetical protein